MDINQIIIKHLLILVPLVWGLLTYCFGWGYCVLLLPNNNYFYPINLLVRSLLAIIFTMIIYRKYLDFASKNYIALLASYRIPLPSYRYLIIILFLALLSGFYFLVPYNEIFSSFILSVIMSSIVEEFITRSFFIKYDLDFCEFLYFNLLSSFSFMFMHYFYQEHGIKFSDLLPQFVYSFALNILVYKTKRIELTAIIHMLGNFLGYTLPTVILGLSKDINFRFPIIELVIYIFISFGTYIKSNSNKS